MAQIMTKGEKGMKPYYQDEWVTIYHGDCRGILPELPEADVLFTDPDYGVGADYGHPKLKKVEADNLLLETLNLCSIKSGHGLVFWVGSWKRILDFNTIVGQSTWSIKHLGIWYKPNGSGPTGNGLARRFEVWFWLDKGIAKRNSEWKFLADCLEANRVFSRMDEGVWHPNQKPNVLCERLIKFFSDVNDLILDPFLGSGTTACCAKKLNRKCIGIEIEEKYCEIAANRCRQMVFDLR